VLFALFIIPFLLSCGYYVSISEKNIFADRFFFMIELSDIIKFDVEKLH
jgi:hypothetical protein